MQTQTTNIVEQAIAKQEAEEAGIVTDDNKDPKGGSDDKGAQDDKGSKSKSGADDKDDKGAGKSGERAKPQYDKDGKRIEPEAAKDDDKSELDKDGKPVEKPKEGEFTADDALEVEQPKAPEAPKDNAGVILSSAEQKHIVDNIGEPIVIRGFRGEGENRKEVEIKAFSPQDIPADFFFANDQQRMAAQTGFYNIEQRANKLLGEFRQNQSQSAARDFEQRENEGIRADIADLQKEGRFPKFTVRPGEQGFDDSPEAKQVAEVVKIMSDRNQTYYQQYQQGRPYKHIGFAEAFDIWERQQSKAADTKKLDDEQKQEDEERRERGAERGASNRGMNPNNIRKPTIRPGTTTRDILARIDADDSY